MVKSYCKGFQAFTRLAWRLSCTALETLHMNDSVDLQPYALTMSLAINPAWICL